MLYVPLDSAKDEIRLLTIQPSNELKAALDCTLEIRSLSEKPSFQSLSYAWGSAAATVPLHVNDGELSITENLNSALQAVRKREQTVSLWVDAICINQDDLLERNHQVQLMRKVYTSASCVNIWLGQEFVGTNVAFLILTRLARGTPLRALLAAGDPKDAPSRVEHLTKIFQYSWWRRLWVIQEVLLAEEAMVYCGAHCINFRTIMQAFETLWNETIATGQQLRRMCGTDRIGSLIRQLEATIRRLHTIHGFVYFYGPDSKRQFRNSPASTLPFLLHTCSWSQVTDPRDKIYGALGLFTATLLEPDYSLSVDQVFTRSAFDIMRHTGNLALLSQASKVHSRENGLPSWVPDWRAPSVTAAPFLVFHGLYNASKSTQPKIELEDSRRLQVNAIIVDEIVEIGTRYDDLGCAHSEDLPAILKPILHDWEALFGKNIQVQHSEASPSPMMNSVETPWTPQPASAILPPRSLGKEARTKRLPSVATLPPRSLRVGQGDSPSDRGMAPQSTRAPLYQDADYTIELQNKRLRTVASIPPSAFPMQSAKTPIYHDQDYGKVLSRSTPVAAIKRQSEAKYKSYDSHSHSYVTSTSERSGAGTWFPWSQAHLLIWMAKHRFSWAWQAAVKNLKVQGAEFLRQARADLKSLLESVLHNVLAYERRIGLPQNHNITAEHRIECSRLQVLIKQDFDIPTPVPTNEPGNNLPPNPSNARPASEVNHTKPSSHQDFWRTLCMDVIDCQVFQQHRRCAEPDKGRVQEWIDWVSAGGRLNRSSEGIPQLHWHLNTVLQGKRMVTTHAGRLGLASGNVQPGDKICIFAGEAYPYLVRPVSDGELGRRYTLVCPTYVHGLMDGEALRAVESAVEFESILIE